MRKLIVSNFVSLDGFIARENGELDWFIANDEFFNDANALLKNMGAILFGRITFEGMSQYWPTATIEDTPLAEQMNRLPKYVVSNSLKTAEWGKYNNAHVLGGNLHEEIARLKAEAGKDIVIYGSGKLVASLTELGLIDEYELIVVPVVLSCGKALFAGLSQAKKLKLLQTKTYQTGVTLLNYGLVP